MSEHLRSTVKKTHFKYKSWNSIFNLLAQIATAAPVQADQSAVQKIIELCDDLLNKISESREIERKDFQHWVEEYNQARGGLVDRLNEVNNQISTLEGEIATLNKRISNAQYEKEEQDKRAQDKQVQHDDKLTFCDDENLAYSDRRELRDDDREVVSQTIGLLQAKLRMFRKYVNDRTSKVTKAKLWEWWHFNFNIH